MTIILPLNPTVKTSEFTVGKTRMFVVTVAQQLNPPAHQTPSYLKEFMWCESHETPRAIAFDNIMRDIAVQHPVRAIISHNPVI